MNQLKEIHEENQKKFFAFSIGMVFKVIGYFVLFMLDWRIGLGIMLIEKSGELLYSSK